MLRRITLLTLLVLVGAAVPAAAQRDRTPMQRAPSTDDDRVRKLESRVSALQQQVAELTSRLQALESDAGSSMIGFTDQGSSLVLEHGGARLEVGASGVSMEGTSVHLKANGSATVETAGVLDLKGSTVKLNNGSSPAAKVGSAVATGGASGTVVSGASTVLVP